MGKHANLEFSHSSFAMEAKVVCFGLLWVSILQSNGLATQPVVPGDAEVDFKRLENDLAVGNTSATAELHLVKNLTDSEDPDTQKMPGPKSVEDDEFKPSFHLGEIDEYPLRSSGSSPFNNPPHLKFENFLSVLPKAESLQSSPPMKKEINNNFFDKQTTVSFDSNPHNSESNFFPSSIANGNQYLHASGNAAISFPESPPVFQTQDFQTNFHNPPPPLPQQRPEYSENLAYLKDFRQEFNNHPVPIRAEEVNFVTNFNEGQHLKYGNQPNFENYEEQNFLKVHANQVKEITLPRNHRFPYQFYQEPLGPAFADGNLEYIAEEQVVHTLPRERRVSPWKKIVHLIGTILPFGLLLASLSPNIIQIGNSTQSSTIPLSKLKNMNLPPEHKNLRMESGLAENICEEKNICDLILAGGKPKSNLVQNILWNFVMRTPEETAKDNGLRELFEAVKKRDCNLITC